ncbi:protein-methionine sulfoxide oxidase mical2b-like isoform X2 [Patiria miniata]|uniref:LIM zinc-binding domain-containing protein n=1 Tax=Patiria miniata TaxID=46514 RepID=A0A913ZM18_PATMI|nr:protein-methionine sulfoxide oxidase mical2b-like isoform X2 [Patiria miniata]
MKTTTRRGRKVEIQYIDMVKHDSGSRFTKRRSQDGSDDEGVLSGLKQLFRDYMMSEPDVARVSNESEAYVLIEEKTAEGEEEGERMQTEEPMVEEEIAATKVTSEEFSLPPTETDSTVNGEVAEEKQERKRITKSISLTQEDMDSNKENDPGQATQRGGSKRLDLSKYQPMGGDQGNKRASMTKRLDTSRFSKFEGDSTDSGAATPVKVTRNFTISPASRKFNAEKQPTITTPNNRCKICQKTVYPMEKITADGFNYHKLCFRCTECNTLLSLGNFAQSKQFLYCKHHFKQLFKLKGNYDDAFDGSSRSSRKAGVADSENGIDESDVQQTSEKEASSFEGAKSLKDQFEKGAVSNVAVKKSFDRDAITRTREDLDQTTPEDKQVSESEPVLRPDVVRSADSVDDRVAIAGMRSLRDQFERGDSSLSSSGKSFDFQGEIRAAKEAEVQATVGQVAESTPVRSEDVIRSDVKADEVKTSSGGIRSLKDRFEKGAVSNIETTPVKPVIEVRPLEDYNPGDSESGVSENTPVVRDDVVRSSEKVDDGFFKAGGARSLKERFEQGKVSNIEGKPKEKIEISPRSLEEYGADQDSIDQGGVSENTPAQRDDVVREGKGEENPGIKRGAARNLRSLFEKGEVHNIEEKPRAPLERSPKSLDQLAPSTEGVVENTPEVRADLARETTVRDEPMNIQTGVSRSLKDRWEKGEVETAPMKPKEVVDIKAELRGQGQVAESEPAVREDLVRESSEIPEETSAGASSLRAQWEAGEVTHAENRLQKEELSPKRLSSYYDGDQEEVEVAANDKMEEVVEEEQLVQAEEEQAVEQQVEAEEEQSAEPEADQEVEAESEQEVEAKGEPLVELDVEQEVGVQEEQLLQFDAEPEKQDVEEDEAVNGQPEEENQQVINGHTEENGLESEVASPQLDGEEPTTDFPEQTAPGQDMASWEIKAARAAALQDAEEAADEGTPVDGANTGLLIDF